MKELRVTSRFNKYAKLLTPHVSRHLLDEDEEIAQLSEDIIIKFGEKNPDAIEPAVQTVLKRIKDRPGYRENDLRTIGKLGKIKPEYVENHISKIMSDIKSSPEWNVRRFAAYALGDIGSTNPEVVKEALPILAMYLSSSEWWLPHLKEAEKRKNSVGGITFSFSLEEDPEVWVRDAAILALGNIGERNPEIVKSTIPKIISCLKRRQPYTHKRAVVTLGQIAKTDSSSIELALPTLEKMAREEHDEKVKIEAKRLLENIIAERKLKE